MRFDVGGPAANASIGGVCSDVTDAPDVTGSVDRIRSAVRNGEP
jgi:hypothetical protein